MVAYRIELRCSQGVDLKICRTNTAIWNWSKTRRIRYYGGRILGVSCINEPLSVLLDVLILCSIWLIIWVDVSAQDAIIIHIFWKPVIVNSNPAVRGTCGSLTCSNPEAQTARGSVSFILNKGSYDSIKIDKFLNKNRTWKKHVSIKTVHCLWSKVVVVWKHKLEIQTIILLKTSSKRLWQHTLKSLKFTKAQLIIN